MTTDAELKFSQHGGVRSPLQACLLQDVDVLVISYVHKVPDTRLVRRTRGYREPTLVRFNVPPSRLERKASVRFIVHACSLWLYAPQ